MLMKVLFLRFLDEYKKEGIDFWCITTGNEPMNGLFWFNKLNALGWNPLKQRKWIGEFLGPAMRLTHPNTCILTGDDQRYTFPWWLKTVRTNNYYCKKCQTYLRYGQQ